MSRTPDERCWYYVVRCAVPVIDAQCPMLRFKVVGALLCGRTISTTQARAGVGADVQGADVRCFSTFSSLRHARQTRMEREAQHSVLAHPLPNKQSTRATFPSHPTCRVPLKGAVCSSPPLPPLLLLLLAVGRPFRQGERPHDPVAVLAVRLQPGGDDGRVLVAGEAVDHDAAVVAVARVRRRRRWPERVVVDDACRCFSIFCKRETGKSAGLFSSAALSSEGAFCGRSVGLGGFVHSPGTTFVFP